MALRVLISITGGEADPETWVAAAAEEPLPRAKPKACAGCPLRVGGEWEDGATAALAGMTAKQRATMERWHCHEARTRPCAGMRRLLKAAHADRVTTETLPKPSKPAVGQRWRYDGEGKSRTFEVENVLGGPDRLDLPVKLRGVASGSARPEPRTVAWRRLSESPRYVYLGDFSIPEGYSIHSVGPASGLHCFKDPHGYVEGPPKGERWTWKQARDAATAHAKRRSSAA